MTRAIITTFTQVYLFLTNKPNKNRLKYIDFAIFVDLTTRYTQDNITNK